MKIYVTGDSWTKGDGLAYPELESWPSILGNMLGAQVYNDAFLSGSNAHFMYKVIKHLKDDFDLYLIAWTHTSKFTFYKNDNNHDVHFNTILKNNFYDQQDYYKIWGRTLFQVWHNKLYAFKLWLQQIIQMQAVLERANKNYLMVNTHSNNLDQWLAPWPNFIDSVKNLINFNIMSDEQIYAEYEEINYYVKLINTDRFYKWNQFYIKQLKFNEVGSDKHPDAIGHIAIANELHNSVQLINV